MAYRYSSGQSQNALWGIIAANLLFFILANVVGSNLAVGRLGLQPISVSQRPWTIVTSLFLHVDLWHILANMYTLYFFGSSLIRLVGQKSFLIIYFVGGILGSIFYILLGHPLIPAIGASGAVFAVGGALAVLRPRLTVFVFPIPAPIPLIVAVIGGFVIISFFPGVAWQAHLGGIIVGLLGGYFFRRGGRFRYY